MRIRTPPYFFHNVRQPHRTDDCSYLHLPRARAISAPTRGGIVVGFHCWPADYRKVATKIKSKAIIQARNIRSRPMSRQKIVVFDAWVCRRPKRESARSRNLKVDERLLDPHRSRQPLTLDTRKEATVTRHVANRVRRENPIVTDAGCRCVAKQQPTSKRINNNTHQCTRCT